MASQEYVTKDLLGDKWENNGKNKILDLISKACDLYVTSSQAAITMYKKVIYELCSAVLSEQLELNKFIEVLSNKEKSFNDSTSIVSDVLWLIGLEIDVDAARSRKVMFVNLVKELASQSLVQVELLKQRLEAETLQEVGLIKSFQMFQKKMMRVNTKDTLTQQKFNLLREESEGYSKLITELNKEGLTSATIDSTVTNVQSLIGYFDLDPNRVFDLVLESFEHNIHNLCFLQLVALFKPSSLPHILGFKFQYYHASDVLESTPKSLYLLAATLMKHKLLTLDELYLHLLPSDDAAKVEYDKGLDEAIAQSKKVGSSMVALTGADAGDAKPAAPAEPEQPQKQPENQKFGLVTALLEVDEWPIAEELLARLSNVAPSSYPPIAKALCAKLHVAIEPFYKVLSPKFLLSLTKPENVVAPTFNAASFLELSNAVLPLLRHLKINLHTDVLLFAKLCRVFKEFVKSETDERVRSSIEKLISKTFLPALAVVSSNPGIVFELWDLVRMFPYETRYKLYGNWKVYHIGTAVRLLPAPLILAKAEALAETKKLLRRLSQDNVKPLGRTIGKLSHANPFVVLDQIVSHVEAYDNLIGPVIEALKYLTPLSFDILSYIILERLSSQTKPKLKPDGTNVGSWFQSLATFTGSIYKKYPSMELEGLLQYILNQLKDNNSLDLLVLKEVVAKMGGIEVVEDLSEIQLQAQAGGEALRFETAPVKITRQKKPVLKLRDALSQNKLAFPLLVLIEQQKSNIVFNTETAHLKLLGDLYDKTQETLVQYAEFLSANIPNKDYAALLPTIVEMCQKYNMEPETAFHLSRPVLALRYDDAKKALKKTASAGKAIEEPVKVEESRSLYTLAKQLLPAETWESMSPELYVTFWSLSLYDIFVPRASYENEIARLKALVDQLDESKEPSQTEKAKKKKEKEKVQLALDKLTKDLDIQEKNHVQVLKRLEKEKETFLNANMARKDTVTFFVQTCILPRCIYTAVDALYCAKFVHLIATMETPYFSMLQYINVVLKDLPYALFASTENEATRIGRFLNETLALIARWRNVPTFNKECTGPSFCTVISNSDGPRVSYEVFRKIHTVWQTRLTKVFVTCLGSKEYMEVRNGLLVLTKMIDNYPVLFKVTAQLEAKLNKLKEEDREDLKVLANRYFTLLQKRKSDPSKMTTDEEYRGDPPKPEKEKEKVTEEKELGETDDIKSEKKPSSTTTRSSSDKDRASASTKSMPPPASSTSSATKSASSSTTSSSSSSTSSTSSTSPSIKSEKASTVPKPSTSTSTSNSNSSNSNSNSNSTSAKPSASTPASNSTTKSSTSSRSSSPPSSTTAPSTSSKAAASSAKPAVSSKSSVNGKDDKERVPLSPPTTSRSGSGSLSDEETERGLKRRKTDPDTHGESPARSPYRNDDDKIKKDKEKDAKEKEKDKEKDRKRDISAVKDSPSLSSRDSRDRDAKRTRKNDEEEAARDRKDDRDSKLDPRDKRIKEEKDDRDTKEREREKEREQREKEKEREREREKEKEREREKEKEKEREEREREEKEKAKLKEEDVAKPKRVIKLNRNSTVSSPTLPAKPDDKEKEKEKEREKEKEKEKDNKEKERDMREKLKEKEKEKEREREKEKEKDRDRDRKDKEKEKEKEKEKDRDLRRLDRRVGRRG